MRVGVVVVGVSSNVASEAASKLREERAKINKSLVFIDTSQNYIIIR